MWIFFSWNLVLFKFILSYGLSKSSPTLLKKDIIATPNKLKLILLIKSWISKLCSRKYGYIMFNVPMHPPGEWNEELICQSEYNQIQNDHLVTWSKLLSYAIDQSCHWWFPSMEVHSSVRCGNEILIQQN